MSIQEKAMLVKLSIGKWSGEKYDEKISDEVSTMHNADYRMGRFQKSLVSRTVIKSIQRIENKARAFHKDNTLAWGGDGVRILPAKNFMEYREGINELHSQFDKVVRDFVQDFELYVNQAKALLGDMFVASDYPDSYTLESKYHFSVDIMPVPYGNDFRVNLAEEDVEVIRQDIEEKVNNTMGEAMRDVWGRLYSVVERVVDTLPSYNPAGDGKDKGIFRDSLIDNISDLCELLPRLNVTDDYDLEIMRKEVEDRLTQYTPAELREDGIARTFVVESAEDIMTRLKDYMS